MRSVFLLIICTVAFTLGTCKPERPVGLSETMSDSLEYYFQRANDDSLATPVRKRFTERALMITETMPKDSVYVKNLFRVANRFYNVGDLKNYKVVSANILKEAKSIGDTASICKGLLYIGDFLLKTKKYEKSLKAYNQAEKISIKKGDTLSYLNCLQRKAEFFFYFGNFIKSEEIAYRGIRTSNKVHGLSHLFWNYCGIAAQQMGEKKKALLCYEQAIKQLQYADKKDIGNSAFYYNNIGSVYLEEGNYKTAISHFKQGLQSPDMFPNHSDAYALLSENLNYALFCLTGQYSIKTNTNSLQLQKSINNLRGIILCKLNLSEYYYKQNDLTHYKIELDSALFLSKQYRLIRPTLECLKFKLKTNPKDASDIAKEYIHLSDSLQLAERRLHNKFARIEYETEELKQQNASLLTNNQKLSVGGSVIALALASGLLLRHYRAKKKELTYALNQQKANDEIYHLLQQQQQKVEEGRRLEKHRISQELHDGVMGKLSGIRLNLFILNKRTDPEAIAHCIQNINKIQEVEKEIRTIAYDLDNTLFEDDRSFATLLHGIVESIESHSETRFQLLLDPSIDWNDIPNTLKMQLYRVLQEALTNIDKYACAAHSVVSIKGWGSKLSVIVSDDGIGFSPSHTRSGLGLKNMESRIRNEGGSFKLKSIHGRGTRILFTLPFTT